MNEEWTTEESSALTVALVAEDGYQMWLRGAERYAAIAVMARQGLSLQAIADRLKLSTQAARRSVHRAGVQLQQPGQPWWVIYVDRSKSAQALARRQLRRRESNVQ